MFHLSLRVAWHDNRWNGTVCRSPAGNAFCASLDRIRQEKELASEQPLSGRCFSTLKANELPPCKAESGAFTGPRGRHRFARLVSVSTAFSRASLRNDLRNAS
jgi:hypothetical protein